jgi:hypothetical protein
MTPKNWRDHIQIEYQDKIKRKLNEIDPFCLILSLNTIPYLLISTYISDYFCFSYLRNNSKNIEVLSQFCRYRFLVFGVHRNNTKAGNDS